MRHSGRRVRQVESEPSCFSKIDDDYVLYHLEDKHRHYWEGFPLPVILVLHDPRIDIAYWEDVRRSLRGPNIWGHKAIRIPRCQTLDLNHKDELFETCGAMGQPLLPIPDVLKVMITAETGNPLFPLNYFDLFINGPTDIARKLYFSMSLCMEIAEFKVSESDCGLSIGHHDFLFLDNYIEFLVAQNLAVIDYSDYLIDVKERQMRPVFITPSRPAGGRSWISFKELIRILLMTCVIFILNNGPTKG